MDGGGFEIEADETHGAGIFDADGARAEHDLDLLAVLPVQLLSLSVFESVDGPAVDSAGARRFFEMEDSGELSWFLDLDDLLGRKALLGVASDELFWGLGDEGLSKLDLGLGREALLGVACDFERLADEPLGRDGSVGRGEG